MPASSTLPKQAIAVSRGVEGDIPLLGYITWYSIPDRDVTYGHLRKIWVGNGLDQGPLPTMPQEKDVFRRACRAQEGKYQNNGHTIETDVREVISTETEIVYHIARVVKDQEDRTVNYPKAMQVIYNRAEGTVKYSLLKETPRAVVQPMIEAIDLFMEEHVKKIQGKKVRNIVRAFIQDQPDEHRGVVGLSGRNMRGKAGGVYFVPAKHREELEMLEEALGELHRDGSAYLHFIPVADGSHEREMIRKHHVANTRKEMLEAIKDLDDILSYDRETGVRSDTREHHWARFRAIQRQEAEYRDLLEDEIGDMDDLKAIIEKKLRRLV